MKQRLLAAVGATTILAFLFGLAVMNKGTSALAQVTIEQKPSSQDGRSSQEETQLIERVKSVADKIALETENRLSKWKLKKKYAGDTSTGILPPEKGGGCLE